MVNRILIFSLIGLLVSFYNVYKIEGSESKIKAFFEKKTQTTKKNKEFPVNLFLESKSSERVSAGTIVLSYPKNTMEYIEKPSQPVDKECSKNNFKLTQSLGSKNDPKRGLVMVTRVLIDKDENLPSGRFCFGTINFKAKSANTKSWWSWLPWFNQSDTITISNLDKWQIVGPGNVFKPNPVKGNDKVKVTVTK